MFVHYETEVSLPLPEVQRGLDSVRSELRTMADVAYREGEELRARVGPGAGKIAKEVRLEIGPPEIHRSGLVYPVSWSAVGSETLFPRLNADLIVSHIGPDQTRIIMDGTYQPPLGPLGKVVDRVLLRRVAESTVKTWVDRLADSIAAGQPIT
ncbi:MAG: hypothetical protein ABW021_01350 [Acidimicrobiia bacterium]